MLSGVNIPTNWKRLGVAMVPHVIERCAWTRGDVGNHRCYETVVIEGLMMTISDYAIVIANLTDGCQRGTQHYSDRPPLSGAVRNKHFDTLVKLEWPRFSVYVIENEFQAAELSHVEQIELFRRSGRNYNRGDAYQTPARE